MLRVAVAGRPLVLGRSRCFYFALSPTLSRLYSKLRNVSETLLEFVQTRRLATKMVNCVFKPW